MTDRLREGVTVKSEAGRTADGRESWAATRARRRREAAEAGERARSAKYAPAADGSGISPAASQLAELEVIVERGRRAFIEAGKALAEIREKRLYRESGFRTFADYCRGRWKFSDRYARYLMRAARIGTVVPVSNERAARMIDVPALSEIVGELKDHGVEFSEKFVRDVIEKELKHRPKAPPVGRGRRLKPVWAHDFASAVSNAIVYVQIARSKLDLHDWTRQEHRELDRRLAAVERELRAIA